MSDIQTLERELAEVRAALAAARAEAREGFSARLDAAEAAMIQVLDDAHAGPVNPPSDMSAEFARVVRAVRMNVVLRERAEAQRDSALKERDELRGEVERMRAHALTESEREALEWAKACVMLDDEQTPLQMRALAVLDRLTKGKP